MNRGTVVSPEDGNLGRQRRTHKMKRDGRLSLETVLEIDPLKVRLEEVSRAVSQLCDNLGDDDFDFENSKKGSMTKTPFNSARKVPARVTPFSYGSEEEATHGRLADKFDDEACDEFDSDSDEDQFSSMHAPVRRHQAEEFEVEGMLVTKPDSRIRDSAAAKADAAAARAELEVARKHLKRVLGQRQGHWDEERLRLETDWSCAMAAKADAEEAQARLELQKAELEHQLLDAKADAVAQQVASEVAVAAKEKAEKEVGHAVAEVARQADEREARAVADAVKRALTEVGEMESELLRRDERIAFFQGRSLAAEVELASSRRTEGALQARIEALSASLADTKTLVLTAEHCAQSAKEEEAEKERLSVAEAAAAVAKAEEALQIATEAWSQERASLCAQLEQQGLAQEGAARLALVEQEEGHLRNASELRAAHACEVEQVRLEAARALRLAVQEEKEVGEVQAAAAVVELEEEQGSAQALAQVLVDAEAAAAAESQKASAALEAVRSELAAAVSERERMLAEALASQTEATEALTSQLNEEHRAFLANALAECEAECEAERRADVERVEAKAAEAQAAAAAAEATAAETAAAAERSASESMAALKLEAAAQAKVNEASLRGEVERLEVALQEQEAVAREAERAESVGVELAAQSHAAAEEAEEARFTSEQALATLKLNLEEARETETAQLAQLKLDLELSHEQLGVLAASLAAAVEAAAAEAEKAEKAVADLSLASREQVRTAAGTVESLESALLSAAEREAGLESAASELRGTVNTLTEERDSTVAAHTKSREHAAVAAAAAKAQRTHDAALSVGSESSGAGGEKEEEEERLQAGLKADEVGEGGISRQALAARVVRLEEELASCLGRECNALEAEALTRQALLESRADEQGLSRALRQATTRADDEGRAAHALRQIVCSTTNAAAAAATAMNAQGGSAAGALTETVHVATLRELREQVAFAHGQRVDSEKRLGLLLTEQKEALGQEAAAHGAGVRASLEGRVELHRSLFDDLRLEVGALEAQLRHVERGGKVTRRDKGGGDELEKQQQQQQQQQRDDDDDHQRSQERQHLMSPEEAVQFLEWRRVRSGGEAVVEVEVKRGGGGGGCGGVETRGGSPSKELQLKVVSLETTVTRLRSQLDAASQAMHACEGEAHKAHGKDLSLVLSSPETGALGGSGGSGIHSRSGGGEAEESPSTWLMHRYQHTPLSSIGVLARGDDDDNDDDGAEEARTEERRKPNSGFGLSSVALDLYSPPPLGSSSALSPQDQEEEVRPAASSALVAGTQPETALLAAKCRELEASVAAHEAAQTEVEGERARLAERHAELDTLVREVSAAASPASSSHIAATTSEEAADSGAGSSLSSSSSVASELTALRLLRQGIEADGSSRDIESAGESVALETAKLKRQVAELKEKKAAYKTIARTHEDENRRLKFTLQQQQGRTPGANLDRPKVPTATKGRAIGPSASGSAARKAPRTTTGEALSDVTNKGRR